MRLNVFQLAALAAAIACFDVGAASFDCDSTKLTRVEKLLCEHEELSRLDSDLAQAYRRAQMLARTPAEVTASQRRWLATRNQCADTACVASAYHGRLRELEQTPKANWREYADTTTGLHFRYLGNRSVKQCESDAGTKCFQLSGPGMAYGSEFFVRFELVDGSLSSVADSMWEKEGNGWVAFGRWKSRSAVETFAGDGWQGLVANTVCGIGDERGFHGAAGECMTYLMSDGRHTLIMTTDGASGRDPETQATIRSVRFGPARPGTMAATGR